MSTISDARAAVRRARTQLESVPMPAPLRGERAATIAALEAVERRLTELLNERNELTREVTP